MSGIATRGALAKLLKGMCLPPAMRDCMLDPDMEANFNSVEDYLLRNFDDKTGENLIRNLNTLDSATRGIVETFLTLVMLVGYGIKRVAGLPPSVGYEPWLMENGFGPVAARGLSHIVTASVRRQAKDLQWMGPVVGAIRLLAKPRQNLDAANSAITLLLNAAKLTTVFETICKEDVDREREFICLLESAIQNGPSRRLTEMAASLTRTSVLPRGPKTKASSIAHELVLRQGLAADGSTAYTYNEIEGDFTDTLTEATRREFNEPHFKPRAARNRIRRADRQ
jgi:hypothetical protein